MRNVTVQPERPPHGRFHERHPTACPLPSGQAAMTLETILNVSLFVHILSSTICCLKYINTSAPINCTVNFLHVHTNQIVLLGKYFNILWCRRQKKKQKKQKTVLHLYHNDTAPAKVSFYNVSTLQDLRDLLQRWFKPILTHYRLKKKKKNEKHKMSIYCIAVAWDCTDKC